MRKTFLFLAFFAFFSSLAFADDLPGDILDQEDYDPNTPYYQIKPPSWAFGMRIGIDKFPVKSAIGNVYELFGERQLHYQKLGILSVGLHLGLVPFSTEHYENLKFGGLVRYQLHFVKNQVVVPTAALALDLFRVKDSMNTTQSFSSIGFMLGGMLNLGFFDSETARQGHESLGLLRSYLTLEVRPLSVSNTAINVSSTIWYMGLRLEVE